MNNKHTPGPWSVYDDKSPIVMARRGDENYDICTLPDDYLPQEEIQANAALIAAAPALYEALKKVSKCNRGEGLPVEVVIQMMEAIDLVDKDL